MRCKISNGVNRRRYAVGAAWFKTQQKLFADAVKHILHAALFALHFHLAIHKHSFEEEFPALFAPVFAVLHTPSILPFFCAGKAVDNLKKTEK